MYFLGLFGVHVGVVSCRAGSASLGSVEGRISASSRKSIDGALATTLVVGLLEAHHLVGVTSCLSAA